MDSPELGNASMCCPCIFDTAEVDAGAGAERGWGRSIFSRNPDHAGKPFRAVARRDWTTSCGQHDRDLPSGAGATNDDAQAFGPHHPITSSSALPANPARPTTPLERDQPDKTWAPKYAQAQCDSQLHRAGFIKTPYDDGAQRQAARKRSVEGFWRARLGTHEESAAAAVYLSSTKQPTSPADAALNGGMAHV